jgi:hypothetical protein
MARSLPHGENRSTLLKMAEECERLADQQEQERYEPLVGEDASVIASAFKRAQR